jgi:hypothetical protein
VTAPHTISATFEIDTFEIVPTAAANGAISPATTQTVDYGSDATFTITPDVGYHVADVLVDGVSVGEPTSYTFHSVAATHSIAASFAINTYTITPGAGVNGSIEPSVPQTVDYGSDSPTFTITAKPGYHVADVLVDGVSVGAVGSYKFASVTASHTITASFASDAPGKTVIRLSGDSRYGTAIAIGLDQYPGWVGVKNLVVASGDTNHLPDALCAAGLAGAYDCPLLLVPLNYLDTEVKTAISNMPKGVKVHIVGGPPAVSTKVANLIKGVSTVASVDRYSGPDRYGTSAAVARKMKSLLGSHFPTTAMVTNGGASDRLLDPLVASTVSVTKHYPVMLVQANKAPSAIQSALRDLKLSTRYIVGNTAAVSEGVRNTLSIPAGNRIAGSDVQGDAVAFADKAVASGWLARSNVGFAAAVPDAATGGFYMGKKNGALLLVFHDSVPVTTSDYLTTNKASIAQGYVFGGPPAVTESVLTTLQGLIN